MKQSSGIWILSLLSAVLLSLPWMIPGAGFVALFAFLPLLFAEVWASETRMKGFFWCTYLCFVGWNAITTFWVCNATLGGGIAAILITALEYAVIFAVFRWSKKVLNPTLSYILLAAMWIAFERFLLSSAQISWPWLVLGNAFAGSTGCVQWYEWTGTLGGSVWVWASNLALMGLVLAFANGKWFRFNTLAKCSAVSAAVVIIAAPFVVSAAILGNYEERSEGKLPVLIAQPDFDPYQKFTAMTQQAQTDTLLGQYTGAIPSKEDTLLLIAPETFTSDIILNSFDYSPTVTSFKTFLESYPNTEILFGASTYEYFAQKPSPVARPAGRGQWFSNRNSAILMRADGNHEIFHKSKLVVGTELLPYPSLFVPVDNALGGVMGRCEGQKEINLLHFRDSIPLGCAVCYESIFGEYCTDYVRKGAKAMTVITNDAWWGDTPGYRQHLRLSALRAIELRRDIARCANTGISCIIDQTGRLHSETNWWQRETISGTLNLNSDQTVFVKYGDICGRACCLVFLLLLALSFVKSFVKRALK